HTMSWSHPLYAHLPISHNHVRRGSASFHRQSPTSARWPTACTSRLRGGCPPSCHGRRCSQCKTSSPPSRRPARPCAQSSPRPPRSEEHTSELQSRENLV